MLGLVNITDFGTIKQHLKVSIEMMEYHQRQDIVWVRKRTEYAKKGQKTVGLFINLLLFNNYYYV
jgi:hypothetical protein